MYKFILYC